MNRILPEKAPAEVPDDINNSLNKSNLAKRRFLDSMEMDYEKWHDGTGYDLTALGEMTQVDRDDITDILIANQSDPWRNFEALQHINTPRALAAVKTALIHPSLEVRIASSRFANSDDLERERILTEALEKSDFYGGLTQALDQVESFHTPGIIDALVRGLLIRSDSVAVNFAGMLFYIHGKAVSSFDWSHRPFFLRFSTDDHKQRRQAFIELCSMIGVDPHQYIE